MSNIAKWTKCPICHRVIKIGPQGSVPLCGHNNMGFRMQIIGPVSTDPLMVYSTHEKKRHTSY